MINEITQINNNLNPAKKQRKPRYAGWWAESKLTPEITAKWDKIEDSIQENGDYISKLYGSNVANVIMYNFRALYSQKTGNPSVTIEEAYSLLTFKEVLDVIFRATNDLPCKERDTGQLEEFLKEANQCKS